MGYSSGGQVVQEQAAIAALTNSLGDTTVNGTLEVITGVGTVSVAALERNLSELNAKINAIRTALQGADIIAT